jgi:hypothetical protein
MSEGIQGAGSLPASPEDATSFDKFLKRVSDQATQ